MFGGSPEVDHRPVPSRADKLDLERNKRIISGFDIDRRWNEEQLRKQLEGLLPKNCAGSLVKPNIPQNKKVDAKLFSKSIAPSGCIYLRLLNYLPDSDSDDARLVTPAFGDNKMHIIDTFPLSPREDSDRNSNFSNNADVSGTVSASASIPKNSENTSSLIIIVDEIKCPFDTDLIITQAKSLEICNPVEMLRFLEAEIVN